jgi:hypothetical protein
VPSASNTMINFINDLVSRRQLVSAEPQTTRFAELGGGVVIEPTAFEPDPTSYPYDYYYNAKSNILYKKVITKKENEQVMNAHWKRVSN